MSPSNTSDQIQQQPLEAGVIARAPVRASLREISADSWIVGGKLLITRHAKEVGDNVWHDEDGSVFTATETKNELHASLQSHAAPPPFPIVYDVGDSHAVWRIGNAFLKIIIPLSPDVTREHVTLSTLHSMGLDFAIPDVIYHGEWDGRYYLILTKVPGQTLHKAWPQMDEEAKRHCVSRVARICTTLAILQANVISGIDGNHLPESYLVGRDEQPDFRPEALLRKSRELRMDCSTFVFYHCDLGPGNIIIDLANGSVGIIDWECAGFVPREWVRTKFRICAGMDLEIPPDAGPAYDWRSRMQQKLEIDGFGDVALAWMASRQPQS